MRVDSENYLVFIWRITICTIERRSGEIPPPPSHRLPRSTVPCATMTPSNSSRLSGSGHPRTDLSAGMMKVDLVRSLNSSWAPAGDGGG